MAGENIRSISPPKPVATTKNSFVVNDLSPITLPNPIIPKVVKEADSDLFCPFASVCFYHTNTTLRLKRHIESFHQKDMSTYSCIFPSCSFEPSPSLKQYSAHLRTDHPKDVKKTLDFIRSNKLRSPEVFSMQSPSINVAELPNDTIESRDKGGSQITSFLILPSNEQAQCQFGIKTKSAQIIQGAKDNGLIAIPSETISTSTLGQTIDKNKSTKTCDTSQEFRVRGFYNEESHLENTAAFQANMPLKDLNELSFVKRNHNNKNYFTNNSSSYSDKHLSDSTANSLENLEKRNSSLKTNILPASFTTFGIIGLGR